MATSPVLCSLISIVWLVHIASSGYFSTYDAKRVKLRTILFILVSDIRIGRYTRVIDIRPWTETIIDGKGLRVGIRPLLSIAFPRRRPDSTEGPRRPVDIAKRRVATLSLKLGNLARLGILLDD